MISGTWLSGPAKWATSLRRFSAPTLRDNPAVARAALGVLLLLLMLWHPVPWTGRIVPLLILAIAAFGWLEWLRHRAAEGFREGSDAHAARAARSTGPTSRPALVKNIAPETFSRSSRRETVA